MNFAEENYSEWETLRLLRALQKKGLVKSTMGADGEVLWQITGKFTEKVLQALQADPGQLDLSDDGLH